MIMAIGFGQDLVFEFEDGLPRRVLQDPDGEA